MNSLALLLNSPSDDGGAAPPWLMIIIGLLVGIGIGVLIVHRAQKKSGRD